MPINHPTIRITCLQKLALSCLLLFTWACNSSVKEEHPEYFDSIYKKVNSATGSQKQQALIFLDDAFKRFGRAGILDLYHKHNLKRDYYYGTNNFYPAMLQADSMLMITKEQSGAVTFSKLQAEALFYKGDILFAVKNINEAFRYYFLGKQELLKNPQDTCCSLYNFSSRLAKVSYMQGKYIDAASFYKQAFRQLSCCTNNPFPQFAGKQEYLDNIGLCFSKINMPDSAIYYYNTALEYLDKNGPSFPDKLDFIMVAKAVVYGNQADAYYKMKDYPMSEKLYSRNIEIFDSTGKNAMDAQEVKVKLARLYIESGMLKKADAVLQNLKASLDTLPSSETLTSWYKLKNEYFEQTKQVVPAFEYMQAYANIKDSLETEKKQRSGLDVSNEFETVERQARFETLQKDSGIKTAFLSIAVITSVMAIVIIMLVWYNLKRSAKHVNELKELNRQVQQKNEDLQKALDSLEQSHSENMRIMRIVAHDLKNPISAIHNLIYSLLKKEQPQPLKETFELIKTSCINSMALIKDLLNDKKAPAEIKKETVDIARLLEYCVELLHAKADEKKQQLMLDAEQAMVMLDRQKLWRVVSIIVNNAIKFSPENSSIHIKLKKKEHTVLLSITDSGIGIPEHLKANIFPESKEAEPAVAAGEFRESGLSLSQKIVEEHKGKIWLESIEGKGAAFYIELPYTN